MKDVIEVWGEGGAWIAKCRSVGMRGATKGEAVARVMTLIIDNDWGATSLEVVEVERVITHRRVRTLLRMGL